MIGYEPAGFFLLRAPALPAGTFTELTVTAARDDTAAARQATAGALVDLAAVPDVRRALEVASPSLTTGLGHASGASDKRVRRIQASLLRYATRMSVRPTPYGCFAGVAMGEFGADTTARLGATALGRQRVRADMGWLMAVVKAVEGEPGLVDELDVVWNGLAYTSGERAILPQADVYGESDRRAIRIYETSAVRLVRELAATPVAYRKVAAELSAAFPQADQARITGLLAELLGLNFLLTDLRPPLTRPHPEDHVMQRLARIPAGGGTTLPKLREIRELARAAQDGPAETLAELRAAQRGMLSDYDGETYQLDAALDLRHPRLTGRVAVEIADAASCLTRISAALPAGSGHLDQYREAFVERYGMEALVPVLELLSAERGLGAPATYLHPMPSVAPAPTVPDDAAAYDRVLLEMAADAWRAGAREIELTAQLEDRLVRAARAGQDAPSATPMPPAIDAYAQIQAADRAAVDRGEWRAALNTHGMAPGGCTFGRFFDLFSEEQQARLASFARWQERAVPGAVVAELSYLPSHGRGANVAIRPNIHDYEIPVNVAPSVAADRVIPLDDIHVGATHDRFTLWSARLGRQLVVAQNHMLTPAAAPNACRFLVEVSQYRYAGFGGFSWGNLETAPYLPRVTRGKVVVRSAQWRLTRGRLGLPDGGGDGADDGGFRVAVAAWRQRWDVPRHVYLAEHDQRLLLDLEHPLCLDELARQLAKDHGTVSVSLEEMLPGFDGLWLRDESDRGYLAELIVPLVSRAVAAPAVAAPAAAAVVADLRRRVRAGRRVLLPGSAWSFLKVYSTFQQHDEILAGPVRDLVDEVREAGLADRWFFIRYADPQPHLRIRLRAHAEDGQLLLKTLAWGRELVERGLAADLAVASFEPETLRYGGPHVYDAVERTFEANSDSALDLIALLWSGKLDIEPDFAAVAALDALYAQWGLGLRERMAAVPVTGEHAEARKRYRAHRDYLGELLVAWDRRPEPRGRAHHARLAPILGRQADALAQAAHAVRHAAAEDRLCGSEPEILSSLAHMAVNRLLPVDRSREERCYHIWRHTLRTIGGRPQ